MVGIPSVRWKRHRVEEQRDDRYCSVIHKFSLFALVVIPCVFLLVGLPAPSMVCRSALNGSQDDVAIPVCVLWVLFEVRDSSFQLVSASQIPCVSSIGFIS